MSTQHQTAPNQNPADKPEITIGKLSVRGIGCIPEGGAEPKALCIILGKASSLITGTDKLTERDWSALKGDFLAVNLATGERFRSGKLFLPAGIHESIEERVRSLSNDRVVKFALRMRSVSAKNPAGYSYQAETLMPIEIETDPLADMMAFAAPSSALQLEASLTQAAKSGKK